MRILQSKYSAEKLADALERMDDEAGSAHYIWGDGMFIYLHTIHTVEEKLLIRKYALWRLEGFSSGQRFVGSPAGCQGFARADPEGPRLQHDGGRRHHHQSRSRTHLSGGLRGHRIRTGERT